MEDTYFVPWKDDFLVEKFAKVEINEVKNTIATKPQVKVIVESQKEEMSKEQLYKNALFEIKYVCDKIKPNKETVVVLLNELFKENVIINNLRNSY